MIKIAVAIATLGRPQTVSEFLDALGKQTRLPDKLLFSVTSEQDLPQSSSTAEYSVITGSKGLCAQRNRAIAALKDDYDVIIFFDDDYVPSKYALQNIEAVFSQDLDIVGATGNVIEDGIRGPGLSYEDASRIVSDFDAKPNSTDVVMRDVKSLYGCNMAIRCSAIDSLKFDENLPLYGWLEDVDFTNQLLDKGRLVYTNAFSGVHCGVKSARSPGIPLGYSQIANPLYMVGKGTRSWQDAMYIISRNFIANHVLCLKPEPWVDRWGRVKGNWLALSHFARGKLSPKFILKM
jgi:GT2 family glycosyltransferase